MKRIIIIVLALSTFVSYAQVKPTAQSKVPCGTLKNFHEYVPKTNFQQWIPNSNAWKYSKSTNQWSVSIPNSTTLSSPTIPIKKKIVLKANEDVPVVRFYIKNYDTSKVKVYLGITKKDSNKSKLKAKTIGKFDYYDIQTIKKAFSREVKLSDCYKNGFIEFKLTPYKDDKTIEFQFRIEQKPTLMDKSGSDSISIYDFEVGGGTNGSGSNGNPPCCSGGQ